MAQAEYRRELESKGVVSKFQFEDGFNGIRIQKPEQVKGFEGTVSGVDFTPMLDMDDDDFVSGATYAGPEHATEITLMGIRGMQKLRASRRGRSFGATGYFIRQNKSDHAIMAERMGMYSDTARQGSNSTTAHEEMRNQSEVLISGAFEEVSARLFSSDTQRLERLLYSASSSSQANGSRCTTIVPSAYSKT